MKRTLAVALLFTIATSAHGALMFSRSRVVVPTGSDTVITAYVTTLGGTGGLVKFTSCDPSVAFVEGQVQFEPGTHGGHGPILIRGVRPGNTHVCLNGGIMVPIMVFGPPLKRRAVRRH
ncbi:MAG TPA: hypothetical protein VGD79_02160 [Thermoanaerobaculia bacterium]|jgi:hypothetical protein